MAGTQAGGYKAAATNKARHGEDFYRKAGAIGGSKGHTGGFYDDRPWWQKALRKKNPRAVAAGKLGGRPRKP